MSHTHRPHFLYLIIPSSLLDSVIVCSIEPPSADNLSPHLPVSVKMRFVQREREPNPRVSQSGDKLIKRPDILRWDCNQRNEMYNATLELNLSNAIALKCGSVDIDELDACITKCIHAAAREAGCAKPRRPPKFWWTPTVSNARDKARFWFRIWTDCGRQVNSVVHVC